MNNVNFLLHDKYFTQHFLLLVFKLCAFFIFAILEIVNTCKNFVLGMESFRAIWDLVDGIPGIGKLQSRARLC